MTIEIVIVMKTSVARHSPRRSIEPPRLQKNGATRRKAEKGNGRRRKIREDFRRRAGVFEARSTPGIEFVDHNFRIAVIFGGRHDAEIVVAGAKDDNAGHEGGGETPAAGVSGVERLRHFRLPSLRRGPSPRDRRP